MQYVLIVNKADGSLSALPDIKTFEKGGFITHQMSVQTVQADEKTVEFAWLYRHECYVLGVGFDDLIPADQPRLQLVDNVLNVV